ncbi:hypothetical protein SAMN05444920_12271 [Nonomuraea solani]|uniref:Uncharacterized protein n=1 Tax=Nonomuraea solani TaxID=1144553 RepID=A0A1H6EV83_9ACTN|nr:hypothetical protein [Nonomuraea solani]SEH01820.1 hypothetical protein SAMN05444920_12271 [Nonomuraea solani]
MSTETAGGQNSAVVGGRLEGCYIGGFPFMVGLGTAPGPVAGGRLFLRLGQAAWPVVRAGAVLAGVAAVVAVRAHRGKGRLR